MSDALAAPAPNGQLIYVDASALVKLVLPEPESEALVAYLQPWPRRVSSALVQVEVGRAARQASDDQDVHARADEIVGGLALVPLVPQILSAAVAVQPSHLRSLDAIHLASARSLGADLGMMVVYDERLAEAARDAGLPVAAPD